MVTYSEVSHADAFSGEKMNLSDYYSNCDLCHRHCHVNRLAGQIGYCKQTSELRAARAALHFWEEPCISGSAGSGAVFFSGCSLQCVFCQNHDIAIGHTGKTLTSHHLSDIFLRLQEEQASNINLVTPTHFIPDIVSALEEAKSHGLTIPVVYNTGSYETVDALHMLDGLVDIYLPDLKYYSPDISMHYANTQDYFICASQAVSEMYRQVGMPVFSLPADQDPAAISLADQSEQYLMKRGVIVRHLLLPGCSHDSREIISYLHQTYQDKVFVSVMNQYTPIKIPAGYEELEHIVSDREYERIIHFILSLEMENVFIQDGGTAQESFIPPFNCDGI